MSASADRCDTCGVSGGEGCDRGWERACDGVRHSEEARVGKQDRRSHRAAAMRAEAGVLQGDLPGLVGGGAVRELLTEHRRVATRDGTCAVNFLAFVTLAFICKQLRLHNP